MTRDEYIAKACELADLIAVSVSLGHGSKERAEEFVAHIQTIDQLLLDAYADGRNDERKEKQ